MISQAKATHSNIAFSISLKSHFGQARIQNMSSQVLASPWIIAFSKSPNSNLCDQEGEKEVAYPRDASKESFFTSSEKNLGRPEDRKWVRRVSRPLQTSQVLYWAGHKVENEFSRPVDPVKYRFFDFAQVARWAGGRQNICSKGQATTWKIAFTTSPKSHYVPARRPKMGFSGPVETLKHRFLDLFQVPFSDVHNGENEFAGRGED
jgi:hypothetical protein